MTAVAISSVVPPALAPLEQLCRRHLEIEPLIVGPGIKTGVPILYENPREVGADRIVNAVAAYERWPQGAIVVDFGTATTFDVITARGEYAGGVIAPGLSVSADALYQATAKLPRVEIVRPAIVIGRNTVASMQSGLVFGYAGLVDAIVERIRGEIDFAPRVVGTGGPGAPHRARGAHHRRVRRHADAAGIGDPLRSQPPGRAMSASPSAPPARPVPGADRPDGRRATGRGGAHRGGGGQPARTRSGWSCSAFSPSGCPSSAGSCWRSPDLRRAS